MYLILLKKTFIRSKNFILFDNKQILYLGLQFIINILKSAKSLNHYLWAFKSKNSSALFNFFQCPTVHL
jgi:hypothetical protein